MRFAKKLFHGRLATQLDRMYVQKFVGIQVYLAVRPLDLYGLGAVQLLGLIQTKFVHVIQLTHDFFHLRC